jgi:hypothetical protein
MKNIVAVLSLIALCACTPYQKNGLTGGYSETQLSQNVYKISFRGNGYTSAERASDFALKRAAEIGLENKYPYFVIVGSSEDIKSTSIQQPSNVSCTGFGNTVNCSQYGGGIITAHRPTAENTVVYYKRRPGNVNGIVYESRFVFESITKKYAEKG